MSSICSENTPKFIIFSNIIGRGKNKNLKKRARSGLNSEIKSSWEENKDSLAVFIRIKNRKITTKCRLEEIIIFVGQVFYFD